MRRGTTPTNTFSVPIDLSAATVFITYAQSGRTVIEKTGDDLTFDSSDGYKIIVELSQQDTLAFKAGAVEIQIRCVFETGEALASNIIRTTFDRILKDGVIEYV